MAYIAFTSSRFIACVSIFLIDLIPLSTCYQPFCGAISTRLCRPAVSSAEDNNKKGGPPSTSSSFRSSHPHREEVDVDKWLRSKDRSLLAFGTYAGDFNTFEYGQSLRYYLPTLQRDCGIDQFALVINTTPQGGQVVADLLDLPDKLEVWVDNTGSLARKFNVSRGWLPDARFVPPFVKLAGMMPLGLGAPGTLSAVVKGYVGTPTHSGEHHPWVQDAFAVGQRHGRWPDSILELDGTSGRILHNRFDDFWFGTGSWPLRPFEKATLRLQTMLGVTIQHWDTVMPNKEALEHGVLTQLGGCLVLDEAGHRPVFEWRDTGCCAIVDFEDMIRKLKSLF